MRRRILLGLITTLVVASAGICSPPQSFSGVWKQNDERCVPRRTGDIVRRVDQRGSDLTVETTITRSTGAPRHAVQRYSIGGGPSVSIGADGDEFHTSVVWNGESLVFSIEEHENGRVLLSKETWRLIEGGTTLQVDREKLGVSAGEAQKQTLIYLHPSSDGPG